jgi:molybdopterin synthase catalytic subunit
MWISIELTREAIARPQAWSVPWGPETGAVVEFFGMVRATEGPDQIAVLRYEAYDAMAEKVMREKIALLEQRHPCQAIRIVHRLGEVPQGESAIYVGIQASHRGEAFAFLRDFMDELKKDVPIWKVVA